ncbi:MAG: hypothetical protein H6725_12280 [Sandaracinaceae bacterium]|nr:hypothetical protein [Sandaracinaceae bacterium]
MRSGARLTLDVVVRSLGVGHRFPGGTRDLQDTFVELRLTDAQGHLVAEAGTEHEAGGDDPSAFVFRAVPLDSEGLPEELHDVHDFLVGGFDRTLPSRDATVVRYEVTLPRLTRAAWPLQVEARLRYRRHPMAFSRIACEASRTADGRAFAALRSDGVDPCTPEPVVDLAHARVYVGPGARERAGEGARARRWPSACTTTPWACRTSCKSTWTTCGPAWRPRCVPPERTTRGCARATPAHGARGGRAGTHRRSPARGSAGRGAAAGPPATHRARGRAPGAGVALARGRERLRGGGASLARGHGGPARVDARSRQRGDDAAALHAARLGLARAPRDADLLRTQALSAPADHALGDAAREASLTYRVPDDAPRLLRACQDRDPTCARDRLPVPRVAMRLR